MHLEVPPPKLCEPVGERLQPDHTGVRSRSRRPAETLLPPHSRSRPEPSEWSMDIDIDEKQMLVPANSTWSSPVTRRTLLSRLGASTAAAAAAMHSLPAVASEHSAEDRKIGTVRGEERREQAFQNRVKAARTERAIAVPAQIDNGDEAQYPNRIGNHSKDLPHDAHGEVVPEAYDALLTALASGDPRNFARIPLGGNVKIANPQGGLAFTLQGTDGAQLTIPPSPALASAERAGEMVEDYWMALTRDVPFSLYGKERMTAAAIDELNRLSDFRGPKAHGQVDPGTLFRGSTR